MNKHQQAIISVIKKRINRGANLLHIQEYQNKLKQAWKNSTHMIEFINAIDINSLLQDSKGAKQYE